MLLLLTKKLILKGFKGRRKIELLFNKHSVSNLVHSVTTKETLREIQSILNISLPKGVHCLFLGTGKYICTRSHRTQPGKPMTCAS